MIFLGLVCFAQFFWQLFLSESSYLKAFMFWKHAETHDFVLLYF